MHLCDRIFFCIFEGKHSYRRIDFIWRGAIDHDGCIATFRRTACNAGMGRLYSGSRRITVTVMARCKRAIVMGGFVDGRRWLGLGGVFHPWQKNTSPTGPDCRKFFADSTHVCGHVIVFNQHDARKY